MISIIDKKLIYLYTYNKEYKHNSILMNIKT